MRGYYHGEEGQQTDLLAIAQQAAPVISALVLPSDPIERKAVLEAKIQNMKGMKAKFPFMSSYYDNEIRKLKAKLAATTRATGLQVEQEQSRRVFRYLGWAGIGVAVLFGLALTARTLRKK